MCLHNIKQWEALGETRYALGWKESLRSDASLWELAVSFCGGREYIPPEGRNCQTKEEWAEFREKHGHKIFSAWADPTGLGVVPQCVYHVEVADLKVLRSKRKIEIDYLFLGQVGLWQVRAVRLRRGGALKEIRDSRFHSPCLDSVMTHLYSKLLSLEIN
jgi:hypothetical protein